MQPSVFDKLAQLVLVRDLQSFLGEKVTAQQTVSQVNGLLGETDLLPSMAELNLVFDGEKLIGWIDAEALVCAPDRDEPVESVAKPISPDSIISADTTALEVVRLFTSRPRDFFFVQDPTGITGVLYFADLFRPAFRLCLLGLTLHLEESALRLIRWTHSKSWEALSPERQQDARTIYERRYRRQPQEDFPYALLGCTQFCDKKEILKKLKLIPGVSNKKIESVFAYAEKVRNPFAHPDPDEYEIDSGGLAGIEIKDLCHFIDEAKDLIKRIEKEIPYPL